MSFVIPATAAAITLSGLPVELGWRAVLAAGQPALHLLGAFFKVQAVYGQAAIEQGPVVQGQAYKTVYLFDVIGIGPAKPIVTLADKNRRDVNDVRVGGGVLSAQVVIAFRLVRHRRAHVPSLPEHPAIDRRAIGDKGLVRPFLFYLPAQNGLSEKLLIGNFRRVFVSHLVAQRTRHFFNHRQSQFLRQKISE